MPVRAFFPGALVVSKCAASMPLYRLEKAYARVGVPISRSTMNELFHRAAELLKPIYDDLLSAIRCEHVVHADETPMRVQARRKKAYVWTFRAGKNIGDVFTKSRSGATPREVLGDSQGVLVVDAYTGYNTVLGVNGRVRVACMAQRTACSLCASWTENRTRVQAVNWLAGTGSSTFSQWTSSTCRSILER